MTPIVEASLEGLPGPTHQYGGLAYGNVHAMQNAHSVSSPRLAALESLDKMALLLSMGVRVALMLPQPRPLWRFFSQMGFGDVPSVSTLSRAYEGAPELFFAGISGSGMWVANAATVTASRDSLDGRVHLTPANLISHVHRSIESAYTTDFFRRHMPEFSVHDPLPAPFADEGAANGMRFDNGAYVFVYGRTLGDCGNTHFPARQTLEAFQVISRRHRLTRPVFFARQHPVAIDAGVFHQDVIGFVCGDALVVHEAAYDAVMFDPDVEESLASFCHSNGVRLLIIRESEVSLAAVVRSYLCNGQVVRDRSGQLVILLPSRCKSDTAVQSWLSRYGDQLRAEIRYLSVEQSLCNGGGPACLRLRLPLTASEWDTINSKILLNTQRLQKMRRLVSASYPDTFVPTDLLDPTVLRHVMGIPGALWDCLG